MSQNISNTTIYISIVDGHSSQTQWKITTNYDHHKLVKTEIKIIICNWSSELIFWILVPFVENVFSHFFNFNVEKVSSNRFIFDCFCRNLTSELFDERHQNIVFPINSQLLLINTWKSFSWNVLKSTLVTNFLYSNGK